MGRARGRERRKEGKGRGRQKSPCPKGQACPRMAVYLVLEQLAAPLFVTLVELSPLNL